MQKIFDCKRWSVARMGWWTALGGGEVVPGASRSGGGRWNWRPTTTMKRTMMVAPFVRGVIVMVLIIVITSNWM